MPMMEGYYSAERFVDGSVAMFFHCSIGVVPFLHIKSQKQLRQIIVILEACKDDHDIPEALRQWDKETPYEGI